MRSAFRPLRSQHVFGVLVEALRAVTQRDPDKFRVLQFSVQYDHLHLIVEAADTDSLSSGLRGLSIRIARYVNDLLRIKGKFWADRWHGRALTSPRAVRSALVYVLTNFRKHAKRPLPPGVDPFSSGLHFDGWRTKGTPPRVVAHAAERAPAELTDDCVTPARSWLARTGWRKHGLITLSEQPHG